MSESKDSESIKQEIEKFYKRYNPENLVNIDKIIEKFRGREHILCAKLQKKYNAHPNILPTPIEDNKTISRETKEIEKEVLENQSNSAITYSSEDLFRPTFIQEGELEFRSKCFNPLKAIQEKIPPLISVLPLDNLHKARILLPENDKNACSTISIVKPEKSLLSNLQDKKPSEKIRSQPSNLLQTISDTYIIGPFQVLRNCFDKKVRLNVILRRVNSVRGVCNGYLRAFDKHMNLVLGDAHDLSLLPRTKRNQQNDIISTYYSQLFIRGDNVVLVYQGSRSDGNRFLNALIR